MAQDLAALTNTWMVNPSMMDWTQASNQFSNFNNARIPFPPSYNTGAGGPVNAATGQPIQSFQQWQAANPGGMSINATPAQPQAQAPQQGGGLSFAGLAPPSPGGPSTQAQYAYNLGLGGIGPSSSYNPGSAQGQAWMQQQGQQRPAVNGVGTTGAQPGAAPNNWQAAINALANPGHVQTPGATVPQVTGYQPSGGVNAAFLQNAGQGQGMNSNFLSALRAIQGR